MPPLSTAAVSLVIGMLDGLFSGLTGIGGGAILVPLFVSLLRIPQHRAHGTSLAVIVLVSLAGVPVYAQQGAIDWTLVAELAAGSLVGVILGARLMLRMRALHLRRGFGVLLILVALRMFIG